VVSTHTTLNILYTAYVSYDFNLVLILQVIVIGCIYNLPKPSGHCIYHQFNIQQLYVLPTLYLRVLCGSQNKQRLFPYTALTDWFL